jgi:hypothetical protein
MLRFGYQDVSTDEMFHLLQITFGISLKYYYGVHYIVQNRQLIQQTEWTEAGRNGFDSG